MPGQLSNGSLLGRLSATFATTGEHNESLIGELCLLQNCQLKTSSWLRQQIVITTNFKRLACSLFNHSLEGDYPTDLWHYPFKIGIIR